MPVPPAEDNDPNAIAPATLPPWVLPVQETNWDDW